MTYRDFLAAKAAELRRRQIGSDDTAFLDVSLILAHCLGIPRTQLLMKYPETIAAGGIPPAFEEAWTRRLAGESVAYIVGAKEFFGRDFLVDRRVLVPRPDTETLVSAALEVGDAMTRDGRGRSGQGRSSQGRPGHALRLHDLCTGSGAVAISVVAERPAWSVSASDISADALDLARVNASRLLKKELPLLLADLLAGLEGPFDIITANPPYVPTGETAALLSQGWNEPALALDGGPDGLDIVSRLVRQAGAVLAPGGFLLIETDALQSESLRVMFKREGFSDIRVWRDLAGLERITGARRP
ncbi:MAG TPA: peptide chain release factor N(5)-glutamine methyltransferase [Rectinemataceae bacterium]|nr:peptide chain release factor N(5)-glutamine methyltransferase [Rectinemataceae bacterium]